MTIASTTVMLPAITQTRRSDITTIRRCRRLRHIRPYQWPPLARRRPTDDDLLDDVEAPAADHRARGRMCMDHSLQAALSAVLMMNLKTKHVLCALIILQDGGEITRGVQGMVVIDLVARSCSFVRTCGRRRHVTGRHGEGTGLMRALYRLFVFVLCPIDRRHADWGVAAMRWPRGTSRAAPP